MGVHRSLERVSVECDLSVTVVQRWCIRWKWEARVAEWDRRSAPDAGERDQAEREMAERQIREAILLQQKALQRLRSMDASELSAMDAARLLTEGARLEREARKLFREGR